MVKWHERDLEMWRLLYDRSKHLTTLNTVTAAVLVALLREAVPWASFFTLTIGVFSSILAMNLCIKVIGGQEPEGGGTGVALKYLWILSFGGWFLAVFYAAFVTSIISILSGAS